MSRTTLLVAVRYKSVDGWHVFASPNMPGLYVASQDAREAFDDVATAIQKLVKLDTGHDVRVEPALPYEEFETASEIPHPAFISDRTYTVHVR